MPITDLVGGDLLNMLFPLATFIGGLVVGAFIGLYFEDYRRDRDWCRNVDEVITDIHMVMDAIGEEREHKREELRGQVDRLGVLIEETPPYRHSLRRYLEPLQEELEELADMQRYGIPISGYDHDDEPDNHRDLDRIDYIIERADSIKDRAYEIDCLLSYGLVALVPKFLYYNLVPSWLRYH